MDMDNSVVILGGEGSIRELNGNGRKYNKDEIQMQIYIFLNILPQSNGKLSKLKLDKNKLIF